MTRPDGEVSARPRTRLALRVVVLLLALPVVACAGPDPDTRRLVELERRNAELRRQLQDVRQDIADLRWVELDGLAFPAPVDTLVLRRDERWVVLGKGEDAGIRVGYAFDVYRGATFKGRVRVVELGATTCRAEILAEKNPIEVGDPATTAL